MHNRIGGLPGRPAADPPSPARLVTRPTGFALLLGTTNLSAPANGSDAGFCPQTVSSSIARMNRHALTTASSRNVQLLAAGVGA